eukprot:maker-scaffold_9-snap-gene-2.68-mRNA-1 protein AED:0.00 eAED:0.00 QI:22/1/1/1/1/1/2/59/249
MTKRQKVQEATEAAKTRPVGSNEMELAYPEENICDNLDSMKGSRLKLKFFRALEAYCDTASMLPALEQVKEVVNGKPNILDEMSVSKTLFVCGCLYEYLTTSSLKRSNLKQNAYGKDLVSTVLKLLFNFIERPSIDAYKEVFTVYSSFKASGLPSSLVLDIFLRELVGTSTYLREMSREVHSAFISMELKEFKERIELDDLNKFLKDLGQDPVAVFEAELNHIKFEAADKTWREIRLSDCFVRFEQIKL